jgi:hypothetical protein
MSEQTAALQAKASYRCGRNSGIELKGLETVLKPI